MISVMKVTSVVLGAALSLHSVGCGSVDSSESVLSQQASPISMDGKDKLKAGLDARFDFLAPEGFGNGEKKYPLAVFMIGMGTVGGLYSGFYNTLVEDGYVVVFAKQFGTNFQRDAISSAIKTTFESAGSHLNRLVVTMGHSQGGALALSAGGSSVDITNENGEQETIAIAGVVGLMPGVDITGLMQTPSPEVAVLIIQGESDAMAGATSEMLYNGALAKYEAAKANKKNNGQTYREPQLKKVPGGHNFHFNGGSKAPEETLNFLKTLATPK